MQPQLARLSTQRRSDPELIRLIEGGKTIVRKVFTVPLTIGLLAIQIVVYSLWQPCVAGAQTGPPPNSPQTEARSQARVQLNKGVQAFKSALYPEAVAHFTTAVELDPNFITARLYLATAYMQQYIPGADSPDMNELAMASLASLCFNEKKFDDAEQWDQKLVSVNPRNKEAFYTLGVIAWTKVFQPLMETRARMGMKPEDRGPLTDNSVRAELAATNGRLVEEGIKNLEAAISLDPEYDDAMAYENLLYREKADLEDSPEAYKADIEAADNFFGRTLEIRKVKAERNAHSTTQEPR
jgi:tetratricopeptide (TPR) repeat protein